MVRHDPQLLQQLADKTHAQASATVVGGIAAGVVTGSLFGYAAALMFSTPYSLMVPGMIVGAGLGFATGRRRAVALKLQAQMAVCLLQIEENTRKHDDA